MSGDPAPPNPQPAPAVPLTALPSSSARRPGRRGLTVVAVVVVVLVVLLAAFLLLRPASNGGASAGDSFRAAEAAANGTARGYDSGAYSRLMLAQAVHGNASLSVPITGSAGPGACSLRLLSGGSVGVPATSGSAGNGSASFWEFLYQANASNLLVVVVNQGQASAAFTLNGTGCGQVYPGWQPVPAGAIDSTTAAADANAAGGSRFLARYPDAAGIYVLTNSLSPGAGALWSIGYTTCPESSVGVGNGSFFAAQVNANTGAVALSLTQSLNCQPFYPFGTAPLPPPAPLGTAFTFGAASQTTNGSAGLFCGSSGGVSDWCDDIPVQSVGGGVVASDLEFVVRDPSGSPVHFTVGSPTLRIESLTGSSLATYSFASTSWTSGGSTALSTTQSFVLDLGCTVSGANTCSPTPTGELLVALGVGAYTGQVEARLA